ncbi:MAG TPA: MBOAT family O-acyltransferase [Candidatus Aminicenantes bacterium]|nr:MBOAT family O-acyltransferase [Candidatus Aminicenantes bacterium]
MEFNSFTFLFLVLPLSLIGHLLLPRKVRPLFLIAASLFLYYWSEGRYAWLLPVLVLLLYAAGRFMKPVGDGRKGRAAFVSLLLFLVLLLVYFKYGAFLGANINGVRGLLGAPSLRFRPIHLPLGLSFFLFSAISALIDLRRGLGGERPGLRSVALYVVLFPKLLTGPLVTFRQFLQLEGEAGVTAARILRGIRRFVLGLGKKVLLADTLARVATPIFGLPVGQLDARLAWIGLIAFALQIYYDFSGYTDMAIGLGAIFGYDFPENFRHPYASRSITEFWSRWHMTLSQWLRDYVFLPVAYRLLDLLKRERYLALRSEQWAYFGATTATMVLCGLWHGASWTFVAWGVYYALFLIVEHLRAGRRKKRRGAWAPWGHLHTMLVVVLGWVLFRSPTLPLAGSYVKALLGFGAGSGTVFLPALFLDAESVVAGVLALAGAFPLIPWAGERLNRLLAGRPTGRPDPLRLTLASARLLYLASVAALSTLYLVGGTYHPFLYLRF